MKLSAAKSAHKFTSLIFIILVCLLGGSITGNILAWSNIATLIDSREMTYIPQFFETPFTLSRSHADANYLEQTAQSLIFLRYSESKVPELNEDELRQMMAQERDSLLKGEHDLMEAKERVIEKAVQLEREHQQQQRDVLRQQEREMVMEKSRDREFGD